MSASRCIARGLECGWRQERGSGVGVLLHAQWCREGRRQRRCICRLVCSMREVRSRSRKPLAEFSVALRDCLAPRLVVAPMAGAAVAAAAWCLAARASLGARASQTTATAQCRWPRRVASRPTAGGPPARPQPRHSMNIAAHALIQRQQPRHPCQPDAGQQPKQPSADPAPGGWMEACLGQPLELMAERHISVLPTGEQRHRSTS